MIGHRLSPAAALFVCALASAAAADELPRTIVVRQGIQKGNLPPPPAPSLPSFRQSTDFRGEARTDVNPPEPRIEIHIEDRVRARNKETWGYRSPPCQVGMLLPLCGGVGRVKSVGQDIEFDVLDPEDLPEGVVAPGANFPLIMGGAPLGRRWRLDRIGIDDSGNLSADILQAWTQPTAGRARAGKTETIKGLKVGSTFTERLDKSRQLVDYRVTQIVAPNEQQRVPGWITLRPVEDSRRAWPAE